MPPKRSTTMGSEKVTAQVHDTLWKQYRDGASGEAKMAEVWIPPRMQRLTSGQKTVLVAGATVRQLLNNLEDQFPGIQAWLCYEQAEDLLPGVAVIVDGETSQLGMLEPVGENSEVHFLPALGGG